MTDLDRRQMERLVVVRDELEEGSRWEPFVADVARVVGLETSDLPLATSGAGWLRAVLRAAAANPGPVLVLPPRGAVPGGEGRLPRLRTAIIASDDSRELVRAAGLASLHLARSGVKVTVLLVLTGATVPRMWEGAGHHAAAWWQELERRYGSADRVRVSTGMPGPTVRAHGRDANLVVLLWRQVVDDDRAPVVRAVLDEGVAQPSLLVPIAWVLAAPAAAALALDRATPFPAP